MDFSKLRINCNRIGKIFVRNGDCITPKEEERLQQLLLKERLGTATEKELDRIDVLQAKQDESDPHIVGKGAQSYLLFLYWLKKYGPEPKLFSEGEMTPTASNGILKEPFSIELISRISGVQLYRNKAKISNNYLHGVVDAWDHEDWEQSKFVHEIKTTDNRIKFLTRKRYPLSKPQYLQAQGYMALSDKDQCLVHFVLVDHPEITILEQRMAMFSHLCSDGVETQFFREEWAKVESRLRYSYLMDKDRIFTCPVERDDAVIEKIYKKVRDCRQWLKDFVEFNENREDHHFVEKNKIRL